MRRSVCPLHALLAVCLGFSPALSCLAGEEAPPRRPPIPEIPRDKLPPQTRAKPDPAKQQHRGQPVSVVVTETASASQGDPYVPAVRVTENYLKEYFRRAGHAVVDGPAGAAARVEGAVELKFHTKLEVRGEVLGWKYRGAASLRVVDSKGAELQKIEVPELFHENVKSEESGVLHLRRQMAQVLWQHLFHKGTVFGRRDVVSWINALCVEPGGSEGAQGGPPDASSAEAVTKALADIGFPSVPYLIEALTDERIVRLPSKYPGLQGGNLDRLRVYHVADKVLEEIFQKVSRLDLATTPAERRIIIRGWENEWMRFCPSFRESPEAERRRSEKQGSPAGGVPKVDSAETPAGATKDAQGAKGS